MAVLLVEDDAAVRLTIAEFLEAAGCSVLEAADAEEALTMLNDPEKHIDTLVTDLNLGIGDDGLILAKKARCYLSNLPVFYVTGSPEKLHGYTLTPGDTVFLKPFNPALLAAAVSVSPGEDTSPSWCGPAASLEQPSSHKASLL